MHRAGVGACVALRALVERCRCGRIVKIDALASAHRWHGSPFDERRHAPSSVVGRNVRFSRDSSDSSAPSGQNWLHHFRSTANSNTRTAGNTTSERATSLNWKRRHNATMVANVKPTGHIRQNTGNPNTAVDKSAPPSTQLRESPAPPRLELGMSSASSLEDRKSLLRLPAPSLAASRGEPDPKMRRRSGTGHPQAQNARPNTSTSTTPMANAMSIGGTTVLAARATSTAPSGQIAAMS